MLDVKHHLVHAVICVRHRVSGMSDYHEVYILFTNGIRSITDRDFDCHYANESAIAQQLKELFNRKMQELYMKNLYQSPRTDLEKDFYMTAQPMYEGGVVETAVIERIKFPSIERVNKFLAKTKLGMFAQVAKLHELPLPA